MSAHPAPSATPAIAPPGRAADQSPKMSPSATTLVAVRRATLSRKAQPLPAHLAAEVVVAAPLGVFRIETLAKLDQTDLELPR